MIQYFVHISLQHVKIKINYMNFSWYSSVMEAIRKQILTGPHFKGISSEQTWGQFNSGIGSQFQFRNWLFKKNGIGIDKFWIGVKFPTKTFYPQIHLPFNSEIFLPWQSYLEYKLLGVGVPSRYSEYLLMVKSSR